MKQICERFVAIMSPSPQTVLGSVLALPSPPPIILVTGPDTERRRAAVRDIEQKFTSVHSRSIIRGREATLDQLRTELLSLSLLEPTHSLIIVRSCHELTSTVAKQLSQLLAKKNLTHTPILFEGEPLSASHPISSLSKQGMTHIAFEPLSGTALVKWIAQECQSREITTVSDEALSLLAQVGNGLLDPIVQAIELCSLSLEPGQPLTEAVCAEIVRIPPSTKEFALLDALAARNRGAAEVLLSTLLASGVSPFPLIALIQKAYSTYLAIHSLKKRGVNERAIQETLGMQQWLFKKQRDVALRMTRTFLQGALRAIITADSKLKNRSLGPEQVLSELMAKLTS